MHFIIPFLRTIITSNIFFPFEINMIILVVYTSTITNYMLTHWSYVFIALTHPYGMPSTDYVWHVINKSEYLYMPIARHHRYPVRVLSRKMIFHKSYFHMCFECADLIDINWQMVPDIACAYLCLMNQHELIMIGSHQSNCGTVVDSIWLCVVPGCITSQQKYRR